MSLILYKPEPENNIIYCLQQKQKDFISLQYITILIKSPGARAPSLQYPTNHHRLAYIRQEWAGNVPPVKEKKVDLTRLNQCHNFS